MTPEIPDPEKGHEKPKQPPKISREQNMADAIEKLKPELAKLPENQQIPMVPPGAESLAEVQEFITDALNLPITSCPSSTVVVGKKFLERRLIRQGQGGVRNHTGVFAFLYRHQYEKGLSAIAVYPTRGDDPMMVGKTLFWGQVAELPPSLVLTEDITVQEYIALAKFDLSQVIDLPALELFKREFVREFQKQNPTKLPIISQHLPGEVANKDAIVVLTKKLQAAQKSADSYQLKANNWALIAVVAVIINVLLGSVLLFWH